MDHMTHYLRIGAELLTQRGHFKLNGGSRVGSCAKLALKLLLQARQIVPAGSGVDQSEYTSPRY